MANPNNPYGRYTDATGKDLNLTGTLGEQNLAANKIAGAVWKPATATATVATPTIPTNVSTAPNPNIGSTGRMDYSTNPQGTRIAVDPTTGLDIPTTPENQPMGTVLGTSLDTGTPAGYEAYLKRQIAPVDEEAIRQQKMAEIQAEIDAQNAVYAGKLAEARVAGRGRLGESTAIQSRRGLIGSDFGAAQTETTRAFNVGQEASIEAEKQQKISQIRSQAKTDATAEIAAKRLAQASGWKEYSDFIKNQGERKVTNTQKVVASLIANGSDPTMMDASALAEYAKMGITAKDIADEFAIQKHVTDTAEKKRVQDIADKATVETTKYTREQANVDRKFAQDAKQWGMDYALKAKETAIKQMEAAAKASPTTPTTASSSITRALQAVTDAEKYTDASGQANPITKAWRWATGSESFTNLQAQANTLRTILMTLQTDPNTKKFFGPAMSNADVQFMMSGATTLNPELQSPDALKAEISRIKSALTTMQQTGGTVIDKVSTTPEHQTTYQGVLYNVDANGDMTPAQ